MTSGRRKTTISAVNVIDTHAIAAAAAGPARWASAVAGPSGGLGFHVGPPMLLVLLLVLGGLGFGVTRLRRGRRADPRDDEWTRREPPPDGVAAAPARPPRAAPSGGHPDGGWALETSHLTKRFGANVAVNDVELRVPRGSTFGYLGPNGAGKTTLMRTLLGLTRADGGAMSLLGLPVPAARRRALARVGAIVDEPRFHPRLTGRDNLRLLAAGVMQDLPHRGGGDRVAEPDQFALHPPVPPRGVLRRDADHELADRSRRGRPPRTPAARVIPLARDQPTVPGEHRRRGHRKHLTPPAAGNQLLQRRQPQPVGWLVTDPADLAAQDRVLVPKHQQFGVLGHPVPRQHRQAAEQAAYVQVENGNDHSEMIPAGNSDQARSNNRAPQALQHSR